MNNEDLEKLWVDKGNWPFPGIYYCKNDPRIVIPKQRKWAGYSLNWANRKAIPFLIGVLIVFGSPFYYEIYNGYCSLKVFGPTLIIVLIILIPFLKFMSTRTE